MYRWPGSGRVRVTGLACRSNTAAEYKVSRLERTTSCLSTGVTSRMWKKRPKPFSLTMLVNSWSVTARTKLSGDTNTMPLGVLRGARFATGSAPVLVTVNPHPLRTSAVATAPNAESHRMDMQRNLPVETG